MKKNLINKIIICFIFSIILLNSHLEIIENKKVYISREKENDDDEYITPDNVRITNYYI